MVLWLWVPSPGALCDNRTCGLQGVLKWSMVPQHQAQQTVHKDCNPVSKSQFAFECRDVEGRRSTLQVLVHRGGPAFPGVEEEKLHN